MSVQTGVFPAVNAKGQSLIGGDKQSLKEVRLRCLADGNVRAFTDDGVGASGQPNQLRQQLLRKITQRDSDNDPVFVSDEPTGWVARIQGLSITPAVMTPALEEKMIRNIQTRANIERTALDQVRKSLANRKKGIEDMDEMFAGQAAHLPDPDDLPSAKKLKAQKPKKEIENANAE